VDGTSSDRPDVYDCWFCDYYSIRPQSDLETKLEQKREGHRKSPVGSDQTK
jgi:hypothetical protein